MIHLKLSKSSEHDKSLSSMINHTACCYIPLSSLQYYIIRIGCSVTGTFPSYTCVQPQRTPPHQTWLWPLGNAATAQLLVGVRAKVALHTNLLFKLGFGLVIVSEVSKASVKTVSLKLGILVFSRQRKRANTPTESAAELGNWTGISWVSAELILLMCLYSMNSLNINLNVN